jgi:hypothetical protein
VIDAFTHRDYETVMRLALPFAESGNSDAQYMVSLLYQLGFGTEQDACRGRKMVDSSWGIRGKVNAIPG